MTSSTSSSSSPQSVPRPQSSLLIVSDLHLGGALRPPLNFKALKMVARLDQAFERFIDYHLQNPILDDVGDPAPWNLIFNGDTIDFLHMGLNAQDHLNLEEEETLYGLSFARRRSRWKLQEIARYHRRAFRALCRFLEAGNECVFVIGNHDADLWFERVRRDLRSAIARHARRPKKIKSRIHFAPWFYYEEGRIYIEHGHRFDPYSTFPDPLNPINHEDRTLQPTFGHWGLRYFCNPVPTFPLHDLDSWTALDFLKWAFNRAGVGVVSLVWFYIRFVWRYLQDTAQARLTVRQQQKQRKRRRKRRLRRYARQARLSLKRIKQLDALKLPHVGASWLRLAQAVYLDRLMFIILSIVSLITLNQLTEGWIWWMSLGIWVGVSFFLWYLLVYLRPPQDTHPLLGGLAQQIGEIADVPLVVFGHTHHPTLQKEGETQWLNPGTWEHLPRSTNHKPDEPCTCSAKFAMIQGEGEDMNVGLYQWCYARGEAELIKVDSNDKEADIPHSH